MMVVVFCLRLFWVVSLPRTQASPQSTAAALPQLPCAVASTVQHAGLTAVLCCVALSRGCTAGLGFWPTYTSEGPASPVSISGVPLLLRIILLLLLLLYCCCCLLRLLLLDVLARRCWTACGRRKSRAFSPFATGCCCYSSCCYY